MKRPSRAVNSVLAVVLIGASVVAYRVTRSDSASTVSTSTTATVTRGTVLSTVTASGNVNVAEDLAVSFQQSGTVTEIAVAVGDRVTAGQVLAKIENASQLLSLESAQAQLAAAKAKAAKTQSGLTEVELAQDRANEKQSAASVASSRQSLLNAQQSALSAPAGYQNAVDQAQRSVDVAQAQLATDETEMQSRQNELALAQSGADPSASTAETPNALVRRYQRDQSECTPSSSAGGTTTTVAATSTASDGVDCTRIARLLQLAQNVQSQEKTVSQDTASVTTAQNQLTNARTSQTSGLLKDQQQIATSQRQLESAQAAYDSAVASNKAKEKPPTEDQTASDQQSVTTAEVQVATAQRNLDQTTLVAPRDGVVSALNGTVGGSSGGAASSGSSSGSSTGAATSTSSTSSSSSSGFLTLSDVDGLEVTASFTESDVVKVKAGQEAVVTLDALSGTTIHGRVVAVALSSTTANNVVSYKVRVALDSPPSTVKAGMTASVAITVDHADDVLSLPTSAVSGKGTTTTLSVKSKGVEANRTVTIGLRGDEAVEIQSGLAEGDKVVVKSSSSTSAAAFGGPPAGGLGGGVPGGGLGGR